MEERPYVWHDKTAYRRLQWGIAGIIAVAAVCGLSVYLPYLKGYRDGAGAACILSGMIAIVLFLIFRRRLMDGLATFVLTDGELFRLTDANRCITRIAEDNEGEYPEFERDFRHARQSGMCWRIVRVTRIEEQKRGWKVFCEVSRTKKKRHGERWFYLEPRYHEHVKLAEQIWKLKIN